MLMPYSQFILNQALVLFCSFNTHDVVFGEGMLTELVRIVRRNHMFLQFWRQPMLRKK
jgi:hypothetical protein